MAKKFNQKKKKADEGPFPLGEFFTKEDEDFHKYKRGFKF